MADVSRFAAVVFDLDDTLFDHRGSATAGCLAWCAELGIPEAELSGRSLRWLALEAEAFEVYRSGRCSFRDQRRLRIRNFLAGASGWNDRQTDEAFDSYLTHYRAHWRAFADVVPVLTSLGEQGHRLAVLTNGHQNQQEGKLVSIGIDGFVRDLFASSRLPAAKPHPHCFAAVAKLMNLTPGDCVMVGDDLAKDVVGARGASWSAVWLNRKGASSADLDDVSAIATLRESQG